ncbi:hypothetical protein FB45DRAFT_947178 [Roridomyces roridus]|uniref:F-box domain-containing protein n=1 Tax=Roridomyces roridus TaxID=1738132 RepID=A0AAD7B1Y3_9AGAR|nr:hypothetical protein FB45DRAFT_947178 [Roridomyces roridus]
MDNPRSSASEDAAPGTRLHTLLHSNEPPNWPEIPAIQAATLETEQRLASLEEEIQRLQNRLLQLDTERTRLREHHNRNKNILSPLRRMPSEMLSEIFLWTLPAIDEGMFREKFDVGSVPWVLTHVCSRWRAVAISTPCLWSLVMVLYPRDLVCPLAALEVQIQRSPMLKVHFYGSVRCDTSPQIQTLQFLIQHSQRWEELSIGLTRELLPLLPSLCNQILSLRKLWIEWEEELDESEELTQTIDPFKSAVSLVEFGICRLPASICPPENGSLTRYYADAGWDTHWGILNGNPGLVEAHIYVTNRDPNWPGSGQAVELLQLQRLHVSDVEALAYIKVPILEQVTIDLWKDDTILVPTLDRFITASSNNIRSLGLRGVPQASLAAKIIHRYPLLTELAILIFEPPRNEDAHFNPRDTANSLLTLLESPVDASDADADAPPPPFASRLSHIHFAFSSETDYLLLDYERYVGMLESLWHQPAPRVLQAATLVFNCPHEPEAVIKSRLDSLRGDGLDFSLSQGVHVESHMARWMCSPSWN